MLTQYTLKMPHAVYSGKDALDKLTQIIGTGVKKTAVFTDRGIIGAGLLELPLSKIKESGCEYVIFDDLSRRRRQLMHLRNREQILLWP